MSAPKKRPQLGLTASKEEQLRVGQVGKVGDEGFHLFAGAFAKGLGSAEIDRVRFDEVSVELVLADQLAEAVADFGTAVVPVLSVDRLGRKLLRLSRGGNWFGERADLFDRADADAVGFA